MKPDADGYYRVVLGRYDRYLDPKVIAEFNNRVQAGQVQVCLGSPEYSNDEAGFKAYLSIDATKACADIISIEMDEDKTRLIGKVRSAGPHGAMFAEMMKQDVGVFAMRAIVEGRTSGRDLPADQSAPRQIITYDYVFKEPDETVDPSTRTVEGG